MKSFAKFLPSKYFRGVLLSLLIGVVLVSGAYFFSERKSVVAEDSENSALFVTASAQNNFYKMVAGQDSDSDGLKDWEEVLWGTDSKNPDTDKDGTKDGEEVSSDRNPVLAGPNDQLEGSANSIIKENTAAQTENLTPTDIIARDFFSKYAQAKQNGQPLDSIAEQQIASSVLIHQNLISQPQQYIERDLPVKKTDTNEDLRKYGNQVGEIMKKTLTWNEDETQIINSALDANNEKKLDELNPIINGYQSFLDQLLKTEVPRKALDTHLSLINSVSKIIASLKAVKNVFKDPVSALVLFGKYPENITSLHRAFIDAKALFERNNIVYDYTKEPGYLYAVFSDAVEAYKP